jgi:SMC interacting uncharacterized protein involved in chromosome segregation
MNTEPDLLSIDEHKLDRECIQLPSQYRQAAFQAAQTLIDIDELKAQLRVSEAELHQQIRSTPGKFGLDKVTEGSINEVTLLNPKIMALEKRIRDLDKKYAMEKILVSAMDYKKRALTNLVDLHVAGWHAEVHHTEERSKALKQISVSRSPAIERKRRDQPDNGD